MLNLFEPITPPHSQHQNYQRIANEQDDSARRVVQDWAEGFEDRDGKFVMEFQRTFNSSWWELYLFAVLKSLGLKIDFSVTAPDFVVSNAKIAVEAVVAGAAQGSRPEWEKTFADVSSSGDVELRYLDALARLSNSIDTKVRRYRHHYSRLPHMSGRSYVIAVGNFSTPDFFQLGDVAMQRLLYDVWEEGTFLKGGSVHLRTGLFLDGRLSEVSAVMYSSLATLGKVRALSDSTDMFVFQAIRIRNNVEPVLIGCSKADYTESLRDGLRIFHNPYANSPLPRGLFDVDDIRQFSMRDGQLLTTCHPDGDLCTRQVHHLVPTK